MPSKYTCQDCGGPTSTKRALRCHACTIATRQPIARVCDYCGNSFRRAASSLIRSKRFYCSSQCAGTAKRKVPPVAVYAIVHRETMAAYIGSSNDIPSRWSSHRRELQEGRHRNGPLSAAWLESGPDAFEFRILESVANRSLLTDREQAWFETWKAEGRTLFNRAPRAESTMGLVHTDENRAQMRANPKRKFRGKLTPANVREIKRRAEDGEDFDALATEFSIHRHTVYMIVSGRMWPDVQ